MDFLFDAFVTFAAIIFVMALKAPVSNAPVEMTNELTAPVEPATVDETPQSEDVWFDFQPAATYDYACPLTCELPIVTPQQQELNYEYYMTHTIRDLKKLASELKIKGYGKMPKVRLAAAIASARMSYE